MSTKLLLLLFLGGDNEEERVKESATVVKEILDIPDGVPQELLDKAECVVVLPSVKTPSSTARLLRICRTNPSSEP